MAKYTITMIRTYETKLEYDADNVQQALEQYTQDQEKYAVELEQCCVTSESYMLEEPILTYCNDVEGNRLIEGDMVVAIDVEDLEDGPKRGQLLKVTNCSDPLTNYVRFGEYAFYGHRVIKVIQ